MNSTRSSPIEPIRPAFGSAMVTGRRPYILCAVRFSLPRDNLIDPDGSRWHFAAWPGDCAQGGTSGGDSETNPDDGRVCRGDRAVAADRLQILPEPGLRSPQAAREDRDRPEGDRLPSQSL